MTCDELCILDHPDLLLNTAEPLLSIVTKRPRSLVDTSELGRPRDLPSLTASIAGRAAPISRNLLNVSCILIGAFGYLRVSRTKFFTAEDFRRSVTLEIRRKACRKVFKVRCSPEVFSAPIALLQKLAEQFAGIPRCFPCCSNTEKLSP